MAHEIEVVLSRKRKAKRRIRRIRILIEKGVLSNGDGFRKRSSVIHVAHWIT